jgi:hypothetical protein
MPSMSLYFFQTGLTGLKCIIKGLISKCGKMLLRQCLDTLGGSPSARDYLTKMASREDCA